VGQPLEQEQLQEQRLEPKQGSIRKSCSLLEQRRKRLHRKDLHSQHRIRPSCA